MGPDSRETRLEDQRQVRIGARKDSQEPKEKPFIRGSREAGGKPDSREGASG